MPWWCLVGGLALAADPEGGPAPLQGDGSPSLPDLPPPTNMATPTRLEGDPALVAAVGEHLARRRKLDLTGSSVLLGWSLGNVAVGAAGWATAEDPEWVAFHQMSIAWNGINLALAIPGLVGALRDSPSRYGDLRAVLRADANSRLIYGLNTGLDVGWMASGAFLWERGLREENPMLIGFGRSMVLQGGFLFLFDLVMTALHGKESKRFLLRPELGERLGVRIDVAL